MTRSRLFLLVISILETVIAFQAIVPCQDWSPFVGKSSSIFRHGGRNDQNGIENVLSMTKQEQQQQEEEDKGGVLDSMLKFREKVSLAAKEGFGTKARNVARTMSVGDIVVPLCANLTQRQLLANRGIYAGVEYELCSFVDTNMTSMQDIPNDKDNDDVLVLMKPAYPLRDHLERNDWPVPVQPIADVPLWLSKTTYEAGTLLGTLSLSLTYLFIAAIFAFFFTFAYVPSESMIPTLQPGNVVLVSRSIIIGPHVGDVVLFDPPPNLNKVIQEQKAKEESSTSTIKGQQFLKRVVAVPGESIGIKNSQPYVELKSSNPTTKRQFRADIIGPYARPEYFSETSWNRKPETLGKNEYFVAGDNGYRSVDSRVWGNLNRKYIFGTAQWIVWPPNNFGPIAPGNISEFEK